VSNHWSVAALQIGLALIAGVSTAYQPGVNSAFADHAGSRLHGGLANFAIGLVGMIVVASLMRAGVPNTAKLAAGPWWMWMGGFLGAFFVMMSIVLVPKMGSSNYLAAMIAGQLIGSLVIDHFGHMGLPMHPVSAGRVVGVALILGGVACIRWL
jgi:transporter family-2 protein